MTTLALQQKLSMLWPSLRNWNITPLGKGFFEFHFSSFEDMQRTWALGVVNLKPGILRFSCWSRGFKPHAQVQTHAQIWVRLMHMTQEYWRKTTLFEIASGLGTPLAIDDATLSKRFGVFARVLVDVDLSEQLFESVVVETEGYALSIDIQYEKQPPFCVNCKILGHNLQNCRKLNGSNNTKGPVKLKTRNDLNGKKQVDADMLGKVSGARKDSHSLLSKNLDGTNLMHKETAVPLLRFSTLKQPILKIHILNRLLLNYTT